jgi:biotin carboxylase
MAHLLIIDLPGGNDTDLLAAASQAGHRFSFLSSDLALYQQQPAVQAFLQNAVELVEVPDFDLPQAERLVQALHQRDPIEAVLCLIDIRLKEAAHLAHLLGLRYLNPASANLLRDKHAVRQRLHEKGLPQPEFRAAASTEALKQAVAALGLPVLIKPADGYGSQNIVVLREEADLEPWISPLECMLPSNAHYGLGVHASDHLLVERYMEGQFIGCDTLTINGQHRLVGVNEKLMFAPPSFAIQGGCFIPGNAGYEAVQDYVFAALDAVGFDWGAAHVELIVTAQGPRLVEINARLVGAKIPRLISLAIGHSLHQDLIDIHLGRALASDQQPTPRCVAVTRWITASHSGVLDALTLPTWTDPGIRSVDVLARPGDRVHPPFENADRLACVMTTAATQGEAQALAERFVADTRLTYQPEDPTPD